MPIPITSHIQGPYITKANLSRMIIFPFLIPWKKPKVGKINGGIKLLDKSMWDTSNGFCRASKQKANISPMKRMRNNIDKSNLHTLLHLYMK